jgi:UDP-N-acetylbacillosamine N-acetyltransferase
VSHANIDSLSERAPRRVVLWGAAGHAKVVADSIRRSGVLELLGFIDDVEPQRRGEVFCGAHVLGGRDVLPGLLAEGIGLVFAFGNNAARLALAAEMAALGFEFPAIVHPAAVLATHCVVGAGAFIAAGAIVSADARIGAHAIVNSGAIVEHDCVLGDGAHLSPRACLAGKAVVGRAAWIGAAAVVRDGVVVGQGSIVGMGSVVLHNLPDGVVAYGCPARVIRKL